MIYVISGSCIFSGTLRNAKLIICILNTHCRTFFWGSHKVPPPQCTNFSKESFLNCYERKCNQCDGVSQSQLSAVFCPQAWSGRAPASKVDGRLFWAVSAKCSTYVWLEVPGPPIAAYAGPLGRRGHGLLACLLRISRGHFRTLGETSSLSWRYDPCTELIGVHCQLLSFAFLSDWSYFGPVCAGTFCSTFFANVLFCHVTLVNREISESWKLSKICWNLLNKFQSVVFEISYIHS